MERIGRVRTGTETKSKRQTAAKNVSLLVDIQAKMQAGKGKGYERWAKVFNLKEAAKAAFDVLNGKSIPKVAPIFPPTCWRKPC